MLKKLVVVSSLVLSGCMAGVIKDPTSPIPDVVFSVGYWGYGYPAHDLKDGEYSHGVYFYPYPLEYGTLSPEPVKQPKHAN